MAVSLPPVATVLIEEAPEIEIVGDFVFVVDKVDGQAIIRRAMPRSVAVRTFGAFAQALREDRLSQSAEIIQFEARPA